MLELINMAKNFFRVNIDKDYRIEAQVRLEVGDLFTLGSQNQQQTNLKPRVELGD